MAIGLAALMRCTAVRSPGIVLALFSLFVAALAVRNGSCFLAVWLIVYGLGYIYVAGTSLVQGIQWRYRGLCPGRSNASAKGVNRMALRRQ